jgi:hypothetical protein
MKNYIIIFLLTISLKVFSFNGFFHAQNDTLIENTNSINAHYSFTDSTASAILNTNPIFSNYWDNDHLFVYKAVNFSDLGDTISLQLLNNDADNFKMNWYGSISSSYGRRWGRKHEGLDIPLHTGDSVVSTFDGIVRFAKCTSTGYGNCIVIRHLNGLETLYGHLSKIEVLENQFVKSGQLIGRGGSTGRSTGPHLHFETRLFDYSFNPTKIININNRQLVNSTMIFSKKELFPEHFYTEPTVLTTIKKEKTVKSKVTSSKKKEKPNKTKVVAKTKKNDNKKGNKDTKGTKKESPKKSKKEATQSKAKNKKENSKVSSSKKTTNSNPKSKKPTQKSVPKKPDNKKVAPKKPVSKQSKTIPTKKATQAKSKKKKS